MTYALRFQVLLLPNLPWPEFRQRYLRLEELGVESWNLLRMRCCPWSELTAPPMPPWSPRAMLARSSARSLRSRCP
jgi:hypothetical protein